MTRKRRTHVRRWFTATIRVEDVGSTASLDVRHGARVLTVDQDGAELSDKSDSAARLWANLGDQLILFGPAETTVGAVVEHVGPTGNPRVRIHGYGQQLPADATMVRVLAGLKARKTRQRRA